MLNNLTNFFNLIKARMTKTTLENEDLIATGTRDASYGGSYKPTAITYSDLKNQIVAAVPTGVTTVTASTPLASTGGTTPNLTIQQGNNFQNGFISSTDWNSFNGRQVALVSGTNIKTINGSSILGSGDLVTPTGINGIHVPFGVATMNYYTNNVAALPLSTTVTISGTGLLGLTPFRPSVTFTASSFSINVTSLTGGGNSGRVVIYSGNQDGTVTRVVNATLNVLATGLSTVNQTFTFSAGTTYWMGWNCNFYQGSMSMTACSALAMAPLTLQQPVPAQPAFNIGYSTASFTTGAPPATIDLSTYTETALNCVQIFIQAQ
jgi:hypothetical protein